MVADNGSCCSNRNKNVANDWPLTLLEWAWWSARCDVTLAALTEEIGSIDKSHLVTSHVVWTRLLMISIMLAAVFALTGNGGGPAVFNVHGNPINNDCSHDEPLAVFRSCDLDFAVFLLSFTFSFVLHIYLTSWQNKEIPVSVYQSSPFVSICWFGFFIFPFFLFMTIEMTEPFRVF